MHDDVINYVITCACVASHMTFWYKRGCTLWGGGGSVTQDLQEVGQFKAHTGSDVSGASLQLEPTAFNCIKHIHLCVIPSYMF